MSLAHRVTKLNNSPPNPKGSYVLYWMQMFKRASHNYALNFAIQMANERQLPLVVYEGLKFYYPWASDRIHTFILEGVAEKQDEFSERGIRYIFYLQRNKRDPRNTVAKLAREARYREVMYQHLRELRQQAGLGALHLVPESAPTGAV